MDITFLGRTGVKISGRSAQILIDPVDLPHEIKTKDEIILLTDSAYRPKVSGGHIVIDGPGEYEVKGALVVGLPARLLRTEDETAEGAVYRAEIDGFKIAVIGNLKGKLSDEQVGELGEVDVLVVPVGGEGTLKPSEAAETISQLEPKYVLPVNYEKLDDFFSEMGAHPETLPKLKLASRDLPMETTVVPLSVTA